jgi:hypothetical protein
MPGQPFGMAAAGAGNHRLRQVRAAARTGYVERPTVATSGEADYAGKRTARAAGDKV